MFKGNWRRFAAPWIALGLLVLAVCVWFAWDLSADHTEQRIRGEQATNRHIQYAEDRIDENCLSLQGVALRNCIHKEIESARDHSRSEQDLDAQQTMAFFTKIMGATAILGLVLGAGSVALIYMTLTETQRMADETREMGRVSNRPYVHYFKGNVRTFGDSESGQRHLNLDFEIMNSGKTPAFVERVSYTSTRAGKTPQSPPAGAWRSITMTIGPGNSEKIGVHPFSFEDSDRDRTFTIGVLIWYRGMDSTEFRESTWLYFDGKELRQDYFSGDREHYIPKGNE